MAMWQLKDENDLVKSNPMSVWLKGERSQNIVSNIVFDPSMKPLFEQHAGVFNCYRGFPCDAARPHGDPAPTLAQFLRDVICNQNDQHYKQLRHFLAELVQNPGVKIGKFLEISGASGVGKSTFAKILKALLPHVKMYSKWETAFGDVDDLWDAILVIVDDVPCLPQGYESSFKDAITNDTKSSRRGHERSRQQRKAHENWVVISNVDYPIPRHIEGIERRVLHFDTTKQRNDGFIVQVINAMPIEIPELLWELQGLSLIDARAQACGSFASGRDLIVYAGSCACKG